MTTKNLTWHHGEIDRSDRAAALGHRGAVVWLTGLSGSGKSTVAYRAEAELLGRGVAAYVIDGDNLRHGLNSDLGFSPSERTENIRRVGEVTRLFADAGVVALAAFVSPYRADREAARKRAGDLPFFEVWVSTPLAECETRDPKGLYRRARAGEIPNFTGISAPYETPPNPDLTVPTHEEGPTASAQRLVTLLEDASIIPKQPPK